MVFLNPILESGNDEKNTMALKERLDVAFHSKIAEINCQKNDSFQVLNPEKMTKRDKEIHNRRIIETMESNAKVRAPKEPKNLESEIYQAYQILLAEHYKRNKKKSKDMSRSMKINIKMEKMTENTVSNEVTGEDDHSHTNDSRSQKKITKKKQSK